MLITTESFNAGLAELDHEIEQRSADILSGRIPDGDYKKSVAYIQGIQFAKERMTDASDRAMGRKKQREQKEDNDASD